LSFNDRLVRYAFVVVFAADGYKKRSRGNKQLERVFYKTVVVAAAVAARPPDGDKTELNILLFVRGRKCVK